MPQLYFVNFLSLCVYFQLIVSHHPEIFVSSLVLASQLTMSNHISHTITIKSKSEDLVAKRTSHSSSGSTSVGGRRRQQVFVGLGSAVEGLCLYLHQEEVSRLQFRETRENLASSLPMHSNSIIGVICIDVPLHLWKACGRPLLDLSSIHGIPSLYLGYTTEDDDGSVHICTELGYLLKDCRFYPRALALVARDSAKVLSKISSSSNAKDEKRSFDACVWTARLVSKYSEYVHRIHNPPNWYSSGTANEKMRSML